MMTSGAVASFKKTDLPQIRALLAGLIAQGQSDEALDLVIEALGTLRDETTSLEVRLQSALRQLYGRRSEKVSPEQLRLLLEQLGAPPAPTDAASSTDTPPPPPPPGPGPTGGSKRGPKPIAENLPRVRTHTPTPADEIHCPQCGRVRDHAVVHTTRSRIEWRPGHFEVCETTQDRPWCGHCETGPAPITHVPEPRPGASVLALVLVNKWQDHLPLNRQRTIFARDGFVVADSTLCDWAASGAEALEPLYKALVAKAMAAHVVQADGTHLDVLDRTAPKKIRKEHIWVVVGDGKWVIFAYIPQISRPAPGLPQTARHESPRALLAARKGIVQVDGDKGLPNSPEWALEGVTRAGCMSHCRRYFERALEAKETRAAFALAWIKKLYGIEKQATLEQVDKVERQRRRDQQARPILAELHAWITTLAPTVVPKSPMEKAVGYALRQWPTLLVYLEDGAIPIDNGEAERQIRPTAAGRAAWLFAGSDEGARHLAIVRSVLASAARFKLDPRAYLTDIFERLDEPGVKVADLLPDAWAKAHPPPDPKGPAPPATPPP
jgi:transposase